MEQLRACEDVGTWLDELRMNLASWSPRAEVSRHRPRGFVTKTFWRRSRMQSVLSFGFIHKGVVGDWIEFVENGLRV